jgi:tetratricopeptide (TPR) repeat protein
MKILALILMGLTLSSCATMSASDNGTYLISDPDHQLKEYFLQLDQRRIEKGNINGIRLKIEQLSGQFPTHIPTLMACAVLAVESKEYAKAQSYLDHVLAQETVNPNAVVLRSKLAMQEGNLSLAKRMLLKQIHLTPDNYQLRETYAAALYLTAEYEEATKNLLLAEKLGSPKGRVKYHLGLIEEAKGNKNVAMTYYKSALSSEPPFKPANPRLKALEIETQKSL